MMGWRDYAKQVQGAGDNRDVRDKSPQNRPNVPTVPNVLPLDPARTFNGWARSINALDAFQPVGMAMGRWQTLFDCSVWWMERFGEQAARDGWSTSDVFGVSPYGEGVGGLIDRLGDNRSLVMSSDLAAWRSWGIPKQLKRTGCGDLPAWWEIGA